MVPKKNSGAAPAPVPASESLTSAITICRNKHWRYISCFHGPWLQLPPEVLESFAHANYVSPRPRPVDPAVFYDLVKIRKAVDEATNLAVRATSGLTAAALTSSLNASSSMVGGAAALGLGLAGGGQSKLSRERKHRMRELATIKLSHAYHLDEIAASVAAMQSATTLENVAHLVLQRSPNDVNAKYVHFFHEKIPSRRMDQCTPLDLLNDIIAENPSDASALRTRALARIFKKDYVNSAKDLSEALSAARFVAQKHRAGKDQLVLAKTLHKHHPRDWRQEVKVPEEDQPSSLEMQLLFHRASVYFTIAWRHVHAALDGLHEAEEARSNRDAQVAAGQEPCPLSPEEEEGIQRRAEARKQLRQNAKRALRDYNAFLSYLDYTPAISTELAGKFLREFVHSDDCIAREQRYNLSLINAAEAQKFTSPPLPISEALVPHAPHLDNHLCPWSKLPLSDVLSVSQLFDPVPPSTLPPYPPDTPTTPAAAAVSAFADSQESVTYHPLLNDALHSILLCHALVQTPPKEHLRHAHNAARLARLCDGYPIFLTARSPARSDWVEVLRRAGNWINLSTSWESLCRPASLPSHNDFNAKNKESEQQKAEHRRREAVFDALSDERVVDEETFQRTLIALGERYAEDDAIRKGLGSPGEATKRWAQEDGRDYTISTERAEAISRWVRDAPTIVQSSGGKKRTKGKGKRTPGLGPKSTTEASLADSINGMKVENED